MEAFNATIKRSYTLGVRHSLPALFDIFERLIRDVSLDLVSGRKDYETLRLPSREVTNNAKKIDNTTYVITRLSETELRYVMCYKPVTITFYVQLLTQNTFLYSPINVTVTPVVRREQQIL